MPDIDDTADDTPLPSLIWDPLPPPPDVILFDTEDLRHRSIEVAPLNPFPSVASATTFLAESGFGHVADKVKLLWGSPELAAYLNRITIASRHDRQGFPAEVMQALMYVRAEHDATGLQSSDPEEQGMCSVWDNADSLR